MPAGDNSILIMSQWVIIVLSVLVVLRCLRSMLAAGYESETWAFLRSGRDTLPVNHWENIIGRSRSSDVRINKPGVKRVHAVLKRGDDGIWTVYNIFSRTRVEVNGRPVPSSGADLENGDIITLGTGSVKFLDITSDKRRRLESRRTLAGKKISPSLTLFELTVLQIFLVLQHALTADEFEIISIVLAYAVLILLEWCCFNAMRIINRGGYEIEMLAFYLTSIGLAVAASSTPEDIFKQTLLMVLSVAMFLITGWWLRGVNRTAVMRVPAAMLALGLLALNILTSDTVNGARNWLQIGGYSVQPSEIVKVLYIYFGANTLDRLYRRKNLFAYMVFSAVCVMGLALMGDFGTALVFFATFLVVSFMRSGNIATVLLAVSGAVMAGVMAVSVKPYIAQRFAMWGHVWEDPYNYGYQQTRALSAAAAGGLFGKGAGAGWLKGITAANTDMVFAMVCEELGLIVAICTVAAVLAMALFAIRSAGKGRSAFFSIAACAAVSMLMVQMSLNVFGSLDMLPFTGVTFPFVSRGGTSLVSCWMMMAFIKGADNRKGGSFVVRPVNEVIPPETEEED